MNLFSETANRQGAERERPQGLDPFGLDKVSELWKWATLIQHHSKFLLSCECLEGNGNICYPEHTYMLMIQQRKPRREKDLESSPSREKRKTWTSKRKGKTAERRIAVHVVFTSPVPASSPFLFWMRSISPPLGSISG